MGVECTNDVLTQWRSDDSAVAALRLIAEFSTDVIARVTPDFTFSYVSPSAERIFRRAVADTIGHHVAEFVLPEDLPIIAAASRRVMAGETTDAIVTVRVIRGDGSLVWVEVASRLIGESLPGRPGDRAVIMRDVSDRKVLEDALKAAAMKDALTGLANRRAFDEALAEGWERMQRDNGHMSLLLIDIDHFKLFNDSHGHQRGDDCLCRVATALTGVVRRRSDLVARYGGEEFAIILPGTHAQGAARIAEQARLCVLESAIPNAPQVGSVTVSIGAASIVARDCAGLKMPEELVSAADRALYAAKRAGRNCWIAAPPLHAR